MILAIIISVFWIVGPKSLGTRRGQNSNQPQARQTVPRPEPPTGPGEAKLAVPCLEASPGHDAAAQGAPVLCASLLVTHSERAVPESWHISWDWHLCTRIQLAPFMVFCHQNLQFPTPGSFLSHLTMLLTPGS